MNYYRILDNLSLKNRWFLGEVNFSDEFDFWKYVRVATIENPPLDLKVKIKVKGEKLDFTFGDFEILIVNQLVKDLFDSWEVQSIPIEIENISDKYYILVTKNEIDAIDRTQSIFETWKKDNPIRPDLAGEYSVIMKMVIDPKKIVNSNNIFRIKGYDVAVIVSEKIKKLFEEKKLTGIEFRKVSPIGSESN